MGNPVPVARPVSSREEREVRCRRLLTAWREQRDERARDELFALYSPLARHIARRYHREREPYEDLVQVAYLGLMKAIERFDVERESSFSSYATPTIAGEIRRHYRDHTWAIHIPRGVKELALEIESISNQMAAERGESPPLAEVAAQAGVSLEAALEALDAASAGHTRSLDAPIGDEETLLAETIGELETRYDRVEQAASVQPALRALSPQERSLLAMRFYEELTQAEIAARLGVSQMQVSRLLRRTLATLNATVTGAPAEHT